MNSPHANAAALTDRFVPKSVVMQALGLSRSSLHRRIADGRFPAPLKDGHRCMWRASEVEAFIRDFPAAATKYAHTAKPVRSKRG